MPSSTCHVDVGVPVSTAYNQWTQFEDFPQFMDSIKEVRQIDDEHLHWRAQIAGKEEEWDARITEQMPDQRIAWTSTSGPHNAGVVTFHRLSDDQTRVTLQMDYEPQSTLERMASATGTVERRMEADLERFKHFVESRGHETGAWRGTIKH